MQARANGMIGVFVLSRNIMLNRLESQPLELFKRGNEHPLPRLQESSLDHSAKTPLI